MVRMDSHGALRLLAQYTANQVYDLQPQVSIFFLLAMLSQLHHSPGYLVFG